MILDQHLDSEEAEYFMKMYSDPSGGADTMQLHSRSTGVNGTAAVLLLMACPIKLSTGEENYIAGERLCLQFLTAILLCSWWVLPYWFSCSQCCSWKFPLAAEILPQLCFLQVICQERLMKLLLIRLALKGLVIQRCRA